MKPSLVTYLIALNFAINPGHLRADTNLSELDNSIANGVEWFRQIQSPDGSFTATMESSTPVYNALAIFMYEYLGLSQQKSEIIGGLAKGIWSYVNLDGTFSSYPGGAPHLDLNVFAYVAARMAGENEDSPRMTTLATFINQQGGVKSAKIALPFLKCMGVISSAKLTPPYLHWLAMTQEKKLPWFKVGLFPILHMLSTGRIHDLTDDKFPSRLNGVASYLGRKAPAIGSFYFSFGSSEKFYDWMDKTMTPDGMLFDYTASGMVALMALSANPERYGKTIATGIRTIESFQLKKPKGVLIQSVGTGATGETYQTVLGLMDAGVSPEDPMIVHAGNFMLSKRTPETGTWGFLKNTRHFPDGDDSANTLLALLRSNTLTKNDPDSIRVVKWLLNLQNDDGGFGTWERDPNTLLSRLITPATGKYKYDFAASISDATGRIIRLLAQFKDSDAQVAQAYEKAIQWLLTKQNADGSFSPTWFLGYIYATSSVLEGLGTIKNPDANVKSAIQRAINFIFSNQNADGGFSESLASFNEHKFVSNFEMSKNSSPSMTGMIMSHVINFFREQDHGESAPYLAAMERSISFLMKTQKPAGNWDDRAYLGVFFPGMDYMYFPIYQEIYPLNALGSYRNFLTERFFSKSAQYRD